MRRTIQVVPPEQLGLSTDCALHSQQRSQGVPLGYPREVCGYWAEHYDWRRCESALNGFDQFLVGIDGVDVHVGSGRPGEITP